MTRIYEAPAYGPQTGCYWSDTVTPTEWPQLRGQETCDVAIVGGGFTGLSAALHLAEAGASVAVLEAEHPGYGASGRNGGFCCLGGAKASNHMLKRRFGVEGLRDWNTAERAAVDLVADLMQRHSISADRHSDGETLMAHTPRAFKKFAALAEDAARDHGVHARITPHGALRQVGLHGAFHGAVTIPVGFALNPRKYHTGLADAAQAKGAALFSQSPVTRMTHRKGWLLDTPHGTITANAVIIATNGYSSETLPDWLRARYLPVQTSIIVTRPIAPEERARQGWTSAQMACDTRSLLHYFRLLPDGRFLFGMRGGLRATPAAQARIARKIRADFHTMFPEWREVEITHEWSGLACLMPDLTPFVGPVPDQPGLFTGLGYHGNGVAMGTYAGRLLADLVSGKPSDGPYPQAMRTMPGRFPLGRYRRALLAPAYAMAELFDL